MLSLILNLIWLVLGGIWMGLAWLVIGLLCCLTIVGIPWGLASFSLASFSFWPFGREAISQRDLTGRGGLGNSPLGVIGNVIWLVFAGIWLAIGHVLAAVANALTIIGIPFAFQHLKLAAFSLWPIGTRIVPREVADEARRRNAVSRVDWIRS